MTDVKVESGLGWLRSIRKCLPLVSSDISWRHDGAGDNDDDDTTRVITGMAMMIVIYDGGTVFWCNGDGHDDHDDVTTLAPV